jgi:hypothetical protein
LVKARPRDACLTLLAKIDPPSAKLSQFDAALYIRYLLTYGREFHSPPLANSAQPTLSAPLDEDDLRTTA